MGVEGCFGSYLFTVLRLRASQAGISHPLLSLAASKGRSSGNGKQRALSVPQYTGWDAG